MDDRGERKAESLYRTLGPSDLSILVTMGRFIEAMAWVHSFSFTPRASALEKERVYAWQTVLEISACHQRGGYVFGREQGLCVREGTGSVLPPSHLSAREHGIRNPSL